MILPSSGRGNGFNRRFFDERCEAFGEIALELLQLHSPVDGGAAKWVFVPAQLEATGLVTEVRLDVAAIMSVSIACVESSQFL